jgi:glutamine amidotransferase/cyclase
MTSRVAVLNYGFGNVQSVVAAFKEIGLDAFSTSEPDEVIEADLLCIPGVAAFGAVVEALHSKNLFSIVRTWLEEDRPFIGLCVGFQILFSESHESPGIKGLGFLKSTVRSLEESFPGSVVPSVGWKAVSSAGMQSEHFYFSHSFFVDSDVMGLSSSWHYTFANHRILAGFRKGNIVAFQFHPEKSGVKGIGLLKSVVQNWGLV